MSVRSVHGTLTIATAAVAVAAALLATARAQDATPTPDALAQSIAQGQTAYDARDFKAALTTWQAALATAQTRNDQVHIAELDHDIGKAQRGLRQYTDALRSLTAALDLHRTLHDRKSEAADLDYVGLVDQDLNKMDDAAKALDQSLSISKDLGDKAGQAAALNDIADLNDYTGHPDAAVKAYNEALDLYRGLADRAGEREALFGLGIVIGNSGNYPQGQKDLEAALAIDRALGNRRNEARDLTLIGTINWQLAKYDAALRYFGEALPIDRQLKDTQGEAHVLNQFAFTYTSLGRFSEALRFAQQALLAARASGARREEAIALEHIGESEATQFHFDAALGDYQQASDIYKAIGLRVGQAGVLRHIGDVNRTLARYDLALSAYQDSLALMRAVGFRVGEANALHSVALLEEELGQYDLALQYLDQALAIYRGIGDPLGESDALATQGAVAEHQHLYADAVRHFQEALIIARKIGATEQQAQLLYSIGVVSGNAGHYSDAYRYDHEALALYRKIRSPWGENAVLIDLGATDVSLGHASEGLASARQAYAMAIKQGHGAEMLWGALRAQALAEADLNRRDSAIADFDRALDEIEATRAALGAGSERSSYFATKATVYDEYVAYLWRLNGKYLGQGYDRKALQVLERRNAREVLEEIGQSAARRFAGVPADIVAQETSAAAAVALAQANFQETNAADNAAVAAAQKQLHDVSAQLNALEKKIQVSYPAFYQLLHPTPIDPNVLQKSTLRPGELLLAYDVGADRTLLWVVDRGHFQLVALPGAAAIGRAVTAFRSHATRMQSDVDKQLLPSQISDDAARDLPGFDADSYTLYEMLVPASVRATVSRASSIIVIPSGALYDLPWEALVTTPASSSGARPHYLVQDHAISYIPSASLLGIVRDAESSHRSASSPLLAFARPAVGTSVVAVDTSAPSFASEQTRTMREVVGSAQDLASAFPDLPGAQTEAEAVRIALNAPASSIVTGDDASRSKVMSLNDSGQLKNYRYLLFATHAVLPDQIHGLAQPALVLAHPENGDGFLTMADVFGLSLNADFVTLSACNTGAGPHAAGQGISGLTRAFLYAGTPAISVTLWEVDDQAAPKITPAFFASLAGGSSPAQALRDAKLRMIQDADPRFAHPFSWAPTIIFGDGDNVAQRV